MLFDAPSEPPPERSVARPLIGLAISICLVVVSFLTGIVTACGPGSNSGFNGGGADTSIVTSAAIVLFFASLASAVGCFLWFIVVMVINSQRS